jgi:hypothetical protein
VPIHRHVKQNNPDTTKLIQNIKRPTTLNYGNDQSNQQIARDGQ